MKRFIAVVTVAASILLCFSSFALPAAVLTVKNGVPVSRISAETMPFEDGGEIYVPYSLLDGLGGAMTFYNMFLDRVTVFSFDRRVTFDLASGTVFDIWRTPLESQAVRKDGQIFVPAKMLSEYFGWYLSLDTDTFSVPVLVIGDRAPSGGDAELINRCSSELAAILEEYLAEEPRPSAPETTPSPKDPGKVYLLFEGLGKNTLEALTFLSRNGLKAAVFLSAEDILENPEGVRQVFCQGHFAGIKGEDAGLLEEANAALRSVLMTKTVSALYSETTADEDGYRFWEPDFDSGKDTETPYRFAAGRRKTVILIAENDRALSLVSSLEANRETGNYVIVPPAPWEE